MFEKNGSHVETIESTCTYTPTCHRCQIPINSWQTPKRALLETFANTPLGSHRYCTSHEQNDRCLTYKVNPWKYESSINYSINIIDWLVVGPPLWKIWKSIGMIIPNIWEHKKCSKPPTSIDFFAMLFQSLSDYPIPWKYYSILFHILQKKIWSVLTHYSYFLTSRSSEFPRRPAPKVARTGVAPGNPTPRFIFGWTPSNSQTYGGGEFTIVHQPKRESMWLNQCHQAPMTGNGFSTKKKHMVMTGGLFMTLFEAHIRSKWLVIAMGYLSSSSSKPSMI